MNIMQDLFGKSPFGPLVEYTEKVHECVEMLKPLMEALVNEAYDEIHKIQDMISRLEYEADNIKHEVREHLPRCYFMPVERVELERFISRQDKIADKAEDFAIIPTLRKTKLHPDVKDKFWLSWADLPGHRHAPWDGSWTKKPCQGFLQRCRSQASCPWHSPWPQW
jgi:predicted phosphate transport protein (TIGR00153 family)